MEFFGTINESNIDENIKNPNNQDKTEEWKQQLQNVMKLARRQLDERISEYLEGVPSVRAQNKMKEFEIRFGKYSNNGRNISKIDYDNAIKTITASGFTCNNKDGIQMLRIYSEFADPKTGQKKMSNIRAELVGTDMISEYCATNSLEKLISLPNIQSNAIKFTQKTSPIGKDGRFQKPIDFPDMGFRVDYKYEEDYGVKSFISQRIIDKWQDNKKKFRLINRVRFEHSSWPIAVDVSIVKSSQQIKNKVDVPTYTIQESRVFDNVESYEIELELMNDQIGNGSKVGEKERVMDALRKVIRIVMSGIQGSHYPIPLSERDDILQEYLKIIHGEKYQMRYVNSNDFIGPSSYTLQMENIVEKQLDSKIANIRENYTVTDKADGERKMLFVNDEGKLYFIDMNMNVQFTGSRVGGDKLLKKCVIDGEHVKYNKHGEYIHLYKAFDIYFALGKSVMENPLLQFYEIPEEEIEEKKEQTEKAEKKKDKIARLSILNQFIERLKPVSIVPENNVKWEKKIKDGKPIWIDLSTKTISETEPPMYKNYNCNLRVECKQFYSGTSTSTIFEGCSKILSNVKDNLFEYETDGLIFTPAYKPVGSISAGIPGLLHKYTWDFSFKWKPAQFNTVDFLVAVEKDKTGAKDKISYIYQDGISFDKPIVQYKTLRLHCGFDSKKHAIANPFNDILHERLPRPEDIDNESTYEPRPFEPTEPFDPMASMCNIIVKEGGERDERALVMTTESGDYFEENMIVEFRYDKSAEPGWNWKPIRVRYDKTQKLLRGMAEYGNAYHVANSNWHSIHNEITEQIVTTGQGITETDIYYGNVEDSRTMAMRNFHNLYVKKKLIMSVANQGDMLIDYAVGKAGDLPKWRQSKLAMVLGIDISRDNISGASDSACIRYLKECEKHSRIPYCVFLKGNSSQNIRAGDAFPGDKTSKERMVAEALFGKGPKDRTLLGNGIYKRYGIVENGFHISSCQFAIHYFFENPITLHTFMRNLAECTRLQGHFICTGYDGRAVFDLLKKKKEDEGVAFMTNDMYGQPKKICEIIKKYSQDGFADDETTIGYPIHVFQETIQRTSREFLVSFKYLLRILENYGFELIEDIEAQQLELPHASGLFEELYNKMEQELKQDQGTRAYYKQASHMSSAEKNISFLNRYCVFKKTTNVSKETMEQHFKIAKAMYNKEDRFEEVEINKELESMMKTTEREKPPSRGNIRKLKARVVLKKPVQLQNVEELSLDIKEEIIESKIKFTGKKVTISKPLSK